ncbi:Glutamyl-tRNA(Gln) amidotransferase subunit A, mitochondrial [Mycena venus]|uniref:Glutamyl-tRNA(Gln) amidotransferase subunit A, mitochondrial n=1 Tax=Mycena venus TaxID=2733690 RepID=A0A8H7CRD1_9AGAR|nr:Glutamyl-tRNA(Gln) amidotransferase subunit A, mitochondrial [Mycena venus]
MRVNVTRNLPRRWTRQISSWRHAIREKDSSVNAFVSISQPQKSSPEHFPLHNVAIAVKDMICTSDMPTTSSSAMLRDFTSPFDATVVSLLREAGADIVGKLNCDEFGMGSLNIHSVHGPVVNPFQSASSSVPWAEREKRSAGGSSGGSAASVAAGMCFAALSTDTGGSTRLPASYCGVVGLKPSYGLISRWGVISFADSLDCVGVMAEDVSATKRVFDILNTYDAKDPTSASPDARQLALKAAAEAWPSSALNDLRIGIPQEYFPLELSDEVLTPVRAAIEGLKARGATIVPVSLPSTPYALSAYYVISSAEASSNMARYDGVQYGLHVPLPPGTGLTNTATMYARTRSVGFGPEVQKRILLGTYALTADAFDNYFLQAQRIRRLIREDFNRVFRVPDVMSSSKTASSDGVDVLIHPSAIRTAPPLDAVDTDGLETYVQDVLTVPASLAGLPALSVPLKTNAHEWPVGVSVVGQWGCDDTVLQVGHFLESINK